MNLIDVAVADIKRGDRIYRGQIAGKSRFEEVKTITPCTKPECVHVNNNCYDLRFSRERIAA